VSERPSNSMPRSVGPFYASLVDRCVEGIIGALGERDVEAILLTGAPARGEATVANLPEGPYSLSDVDLACIARPGSETPELRRRLAAWVSAANEELDSECTGVDASIKTTGSGVYPLIATYEMLRSPAVVWGDSAVLDRLPPVRIEDVPAWDSLVLLHNRTVEQVLMLEALAPSEPCRSHAVTDLRTQLRLAYACGKYLLDSVTALLFLRGNVPLTYAQRADLFERDVLARPESARLLDGVEKVLADIRIWSSFKTTGDLTGLRALRTGEAQPAGAEGGRSDLLTTARSCYLRYAACSGVLWRETLGGVLGVDAHGLSVEDTVALYTRLEKPLKKLGRSFKMLRSPAGRTGLFSASRVAGLATFASPRQLAYLTAVLAYLGLAPGGQTQQLDRLIARVCPFRVRRGFERLPLPQKLAVLAERLQVFHAVVLRGREAAPSR